MNVALPGLPRGALRDSLRSAIVSFESIDEPDRSARVHPALALEPASIEHPPKPPAAL
jgi:hypothetical protein